MIEYRARPAYVGIAFVETPRILDCSHCNLAASRLRMYHLPGWHNTLYLHRLAVPSVLDRSNPTS